MAVKQGMDNQGGSINLSTLQAISVKVSLAKELLKCSKIKETQNTSKISSNSQLNLSYVQVTKMTLVVLHMQIMAFAHTTCFKGLATVWAQWLGILQMMKNSLVISYTKAR